MTVLTWFIDGRWVDDDYYEDKSREEIIARGLKPGDPVGELPDPQLYSSEAAALAAATKALNNKDKGIGGAGSGSMGIYRAGGATTIFGASGWGPYSDGPLNAVRKSMLNRDGLNEENWMWMAATRVGEADEEWAKIRRDNLKAVGWDEGSASEMVNGKGKEKERARENAVERDEDDDGQEEETLKRPREELDGGETKRKRVRISTETDDFPMGVYEPHTAIVHCASSTFFISEHLLISVCCHRSRRYTTNAKSLAATS